MQDLEEVKFMKVVCDMWVLRDINDFLKWIKNLVK